MKRESDLIDVWFDSGAMPYAQIHYPFENKELLDSRQVYPADFIAEGVDQTRGWFFTLHAIATMVFDSVSYKAVISIRMVIKCPNALIMLSIRSRLLKSTVPIRYVGT